MNILLVNSILSRVIMLQGAFMLLPFIVGLVYREWRHALIYFAVALGCMILGALGRLRKPKDSTFYAKEGFVAVSLSWIMMSLTGCLPFWISGDIPSFTDALFEIISGFTTTGSTILTDVEVLSHCNNFWRCFSHWIGGMGVLVFILAIQPMSGGSTMNLMKAESPGPSVGKLVPKMQQSAFILYAIYFAMTIAELILLLIGRMPLYDAICHAVATAGTGGFGIKNDSVAGYSVYIQNVIALFMFLFGINFTFYYYLLIRNVRDAFGLEEVKCYFALCAGAVALISADLFLKGGSLLPCIQQAAFQVSSIVTTTGFATADFNTWPSFSKTILVGLMFVGGCAGSTSGGIKLSRIMIYLKQVKKELMQQVHPRQVCVIKMDHKGLEHDTVRSCNVFLMCYAFVFVVSLLVISMDGFDYTTNFTAVVATLGNVGPGLNTVGPTGNFSQFSALSKYMLMFNMLAGRLEIIPMMVLLHPHTWKH